MVNYSQERGTNTAGGRGLGRRIMEITDYAVRVLGWVSMLLCRRGAWEAVGLMEAYR